jgi:hypothetical protein
MILSVSPFVRTREGNRRSAALARRAPTGVSSADTPVGEGFCPRPAALCNQRYDSFNVRHRRFVWSSAERERTLCQDAEQMYQT